ncbi:beta-1,3-galactosyl-O-glycosyl-glycoprotein beta-1,6-N-acetylglucosaminyltransferase 3-like [Acipenser ruthenus]|uniref:beta-1,3-galactosyl-O-glycosyl-glycoprotein beta-1,6-N-acetylglucosaminyltransferase 3-like n=1 Tax=Acipenser ruthenus TaxID=7906 RepID=UPI0027410BF6|nr:beta-1,3-galactosyl-O-glycosyl-glycoprotein beta-1,6-N-acetylglucosaminyltransferase 3-like [Acipenser ruthenus]
MHWYKSEYKDVYPLDSSARKKKIAELKTCLSFQQSTLRKTGNQAEVVTEAPFRIAWLDKSTNIGDGAELAVWEALIGKLQSGRFSRIMEVVVRVTNFIRAHTLKHRKFQSYIEEYETHYYRDLVLRSNVRRLSRGRLLTISDVKSRRFLTFPLSQEETDFPIAYSLVVHEKIEMFERLLRAIYNPQNVYCVHVDQKFPENFTKAVRAIVSCLPNVFVASKMEKVVYASWSWVQADLNCMKDLLATAVQWRYLLNTCGTDFPIKTNAEIVRSLNVLKSETTSEHKKTRWMYHYEVTDSISRTDTKKSPPPISTPVFSGNAYFVHFKPKTLSTIQ